MRPSVVRLHDLIQLRHAHSLSYLNIFADIASYDVPHRVFGTKVYPLRSSNGSSIIIYGHEKGIRVIWYGGRSFRTPKAVEHLQKANGTSESDQMVIDLDDDDEPEAAGPPSQPAEFEDEEEEIDPSQPYQQVLRDIDIPLGTSVLQLALPDMPADAGKTSAESYPAFFSDRIVIATSCSDLSIRLLTLPVTPPSPLANDPAAWLVQTVKIFGSVTHQDQITSISVTHTAETLESDRTGDTQSRSRSRNRLASAAANADSVKEWSLLVASTSCTGSGLLLIHQIPILKNKTLASSSEVLYPIQRQFLRCSLSSARVSFNPSPYPAERHSTLAITIPDAGCVKIYQVFVSQTYPRGRRGSATTIESTASSSRSTHGVNNQMGKFLVTLFPGFIGTAGPDALPRRKRVLDAAWIVGGRAVIALMEDGEWGVWDLEAAGPPSSSTTLNLVKGQGNVSGLQGGSLTKFAIKATIGSASEVGKPGPSGASSSKAGGLAPLTPHSRKVRSDGLFQGSSVISSSTYNQSGAAYGRICVADTTSNVSAASKSTDESIILSYRDINVSIPSILAYWRSQTTGKGYFDSSSFIKPSTLPLLRLGGEEQHSISQLPESSKSASHGLFGTVHTAPNILVGTDHRLIILTSSLQEAASSEPSNTTNILPSRPLNSRSTPNDQLLLTQGQLDVDGMDRILNGMASGNASTRPNSFSASAFGKSVGFQADDDNDDVEMGMGTPTPQNQKTRVTTLGPSTQAGPKGRLFS